MGRLGRFAVTDPLNRTLGDDKPRGDEWPRRNGVDEVVDVDVGRSKKFYAEILGMAVYREDVGRVFRDLDGHPCR